MIGSKKRSVHVSIYGFDVRHRGVSYEIAYKIYEKNGKLVLVILAGTREKFYEELKRYIKEAK